MTSSYLAQLPLAARVALIGSICSAALLLTARVAAACGPVGIAPSRATDHQLRTSVLCLVNRARERRGLAALRFNEALRRSATAHSRSMVRDDLFSHLGPRGSTVESRVAHNGYFAGGAFWRVAENIAAGIGRAGGSPSAVVKAWMRSPDHRANILDPRLRDFGAGVARGDPLRGGADAATYTVDFGARG